MLLLERKKAILFYGELCAHVTQDQIIIQGQVQEMPVQSQEVLMEFQWIVGMLLTDMSMWQDKCQ